jgi:hypothetical protein
MEDLRDRPDHDSARLNHRGEFPMKYRSLASLSVVPEPASLTLLGLGGLALLRRRSLNQ